LNGTFQLNSSNVTVGVPPAVEKRPGSSPPGAAATVVLPSVRIETTTVVPCAGAFVSDMK